MYGSCGYFATKLWKELMSIIIASIIVEKVGPCSFPGHTGWWFLGEDSLTSCSGVPKWIRNFTGLITKIGHHKEFQSLLHCLLWCRAYAWNISFETLYSGQFTLSTQLIILNYPVKLLHWHNTTVSMET